MDKSNYPPEMKLWSSVLMLTLHDYVTGLKNGGYSIEFRSAREWIFSDMQIARNSFDNICYICNLNPNSIRTILNKDADGLFQRITKRLPKELEECTENKPSIEILD
jgi:hypothetical protein